MKPEHITAVQRSWAQLDPIQDQAAVLFYTNLFARHPAMRLLFDEDLAVQGVRLMQMFATAVRNLDNWAVLGPTLRALGQRHRNYGVTDAHYQACGEALLRTLAQDLGTAYTPEVHEAWQVVFEDVRGLLVKTPQAETA
jgi:hemoglobin-like flavoprotein